MLKRGLYSGDTLLSAESVGRSAGRTGDSGSFDPEKSQIVYRDRERAPGLLQMHSEGFQPLL